jgi:hypothetical protein
LSWGDFSYIDVERRSQVEKENVVMRKREVGGRKDMSGGLKPHAV